MKHMAACHSGPAVLPVGVIAKLKAADVDRVRIDPTGIIVVVVEVTERGMYCCATDAGVITPVFHCGDLEYMEHTTPLNHNLHLVLQNWNTLPSISVPQAVRKQSVLGGQGFKKCACKGGCKSNSCACKKAGILCNSRCHKNLACSNKD